APVGMDVGCPCGRLCGGGGVGVRIKGAGGFDGFELNCCGGGEATGEESLEPLPGETPTAWLSAGICVTGAGFSSPRTCVLWVCADCICPFGSSSMGPVLPG